MDKFKESFISQVWLVLLLAFCFGASLAGIQSLLQEKIEFNKIQETKEKIPGLISVSDPNTIEISDSILSLEKNGQKISYNLYESKLKDGSGNAGYVIKTKGQGYADKIELLVGLDPDAQTIRGLFVLEQKETPGLGNKIVEDKFRSQFAGKKTDQSLLVVKTGAKQANEIDAITGATISSRSVCELVNKAVADLKTHLNK